MPATPEQQDDAQACSSSIEVSAKRALDGVMMGLVAVEFVATYLSVLYDSSSSIGQ
ncbi:hypothetical protein IAE35_09970 [Pseudomonas sp. S75]|uniref:hypothetical protein n=1 Tax=unclassified Pseudomonas TaxID=196821 RepID=UPI0019074CF0|nr:MULTISPECIES: hypothetical protein [unclassified Pseudomonas]MBJ9976673.1 hypothetical protein [Pseudomonas sp. S30]MBK0153675.1 hypothetical protein [Pseudomonas sp. S75]